MKTANLTEREVANYVLNNLRDVNNMRSSEKYVESTKDVDVIIPVLNEMDALPLFWERFTQLPCFNRCKVTFVDNASTDGSIEFLRKLEDIQLIEHVHNEGYGASVLHGLRMTSNPYVVIVDADCEYPPEIIPVLLQAVCNNDVVYASRLAGKKNNQQAGMPWLKMKGNQMISGLFNVLFQQACTDLYTGCKALRRSTLNNMSLNRTGFEHVLEMAVMFSSSGYHIAEVPIDYSSRVGGKSKMSHIIETIKFIYWLLSYRWIFRNKLAALP
jgi:glycosyltransferase involved in cell wall biosynthesis